MNTIQVLTALKTKSPPKIYKVAKQTPYKTLSKSLEDILKENYTCIVEDKAFRESFLHLISLGYFLNRKQEGNLDAIYTRDFLRKVQELNVTEQD